MNTINQTYKSKYDRHKELGRWVNDWIGLFKQAHITNKFEPQYHAELTEKHKIIFPRRKKIALTNLPEDIVKPIQEKWQEIAVNYALDCEEEYRELTTWLNENAPNVELIPTEVMNEIKVSSVSTYRSQGWGKRDYAKAVLKDSEEALVQFGFEVEIVLENKNEWNEAYVLYANCEPYILDALKRQDTTDLLTWAIKCWQRGVNPKVYNPFLDNEIFEKSMYMR